MAILNGIEGLAHVEVNEDNWKGYILIAPDVRNMSYFDIAPISNHYVKLHWSRTWSVSLFSAGNTSRAWYTLPRWMARPS